MTMFFNVESVREYLLKHGHVYSLRRVGRRTGNDVAVHGSYYKNTRIGRIEVHIELPEVNSEEQLKPYVGSSGISSAKEWFEKGKKLHKGKPMSLFHIFLCVYAGGIT